MTLDIFDVRIEAICAGLTWRGRAECRAARRVLGRARGPGHRGSDGTPCGGRVCCAPSPRGSAGSPWLTWLPEGGPGGEDKKNIMSTTFLMY